MNEVKHIISFSGGMGSFAEAKSCVDKYGKENVLLLFADTKTEDEDLYRFLHECHQFLGCELKIISDGRTIWELFHENKFIANSRVDICSRVLKRDLLNKWITKNYGIKVKEQCLDYKGELQCNIYGEPLYKIVKTLSCEVHLGIDFSEHHRLTRVQENMKPKIYRSTLVEEGKIVSKDFSEKFGIKRPFLYTLGFAHNNCGGFCVKSGLGQFKKLFESLPERYKFHEDKEQEVLAIGGLPFLKKTTKGDTRYITMKEYREEYLEPKLADEFQFDLGGCGCAI